MTDIDDTEHVESVRSWRRFFLIMLLLAVLVVTVILSVSSARSKDGNTTPGQAAAPTQSAAPSNPATAAPSPSSTASLLPYNAKTAAAASADLVAYTKDPVKYISKELYSNARQSNPDKSDAELAAIITPPGLKVEPDVKSWQESNEGVGTLSATATWNGQSTPAKFTIAMVREDGTWKLLAINAVQ